jgi:hypothetical protein
MSGTPHTQTAPISTLTYVAPFVPQTDPIDLINSTITALTARIAVLEAKAVTDIKMTIARWGAAGSAIAGLGVLISQWANILKILGH